MLSGAVATALSRVRRGVAGEGGGARHGFTVARTEALLRLRDVPRAPWAWTLGLLRAARMLSTSGRAVVEAKEEGDERVVTQAFAGEFERSEQARNEFLRAIEGRRS